MDVLVVECDPRGEQTVGGLVVDANGTVVRANTDQGSIMSIDVVECIDGRSDGAHLEEELTLREGTSFYRPAVLM